MIISRIIERAARDEIAVESNLRVRIIALDTYGKERLLFRQMKPISARLDGNAHSAQREL
jgi:hypothetical protein